MQIPSTIRFSKIAYVSGMLPAITFLILVAMPIMLQASDGNVEGTLTDQSGGALDGAKVTLTNVDTHVTKVSTSDSTAHTGSPTFRAAGMRSARKQWVSRNRR